MKLLHVAAAMLLTVFVGFIDSICATATAAERRWPTWPTEIEVTAAPLHVRGPALPHDRRRLAALTELERYETAAIANEIVTALDDESAGVQREALRLCYERRVLACLPTASTLWKDGGDVSIRLGALRVLALDPTPSRAAVLFSALRDTDEQLRAGAAHAIGSAPLDDEQREEARQVLLAKLADGSASVRLQVVDALGLLGPGSGTLAIARLLEDPEPGVRAATANTLGRLRDAKAAPALMRSLATINEPEVATAVLDAIARLHGEDVDAALLRWLDAPPLDLSAHQVAAAIGRRDDLASRQLLEGLIERLYDRALRSAVERALLHLGERARPHLLAVRGRGLEPDIDIVVDDLLAALEPSAHRRAPNDSWPAPEARSAWSTRLTLGMTDARSAAAVALGRRAPAWLDDAIAHATLHASDARLEPWLLAMVVSRRVLLAAPRHARAWTRIEGLARSDSAPERARCLAIAGLGRVASARGSERAHSTLIALRDDASAVVRHCTASALSHSPRAHRELAPMLLDPEATVRVSALLALALTLERASDDTHTRVQAMALNDPHPHVRAAARAVVDGIFSAPQATLQWLPVRATNPPWIASSRWIELALDDRRLWLPAIAGESFRWSLLHASTRIPTVEEMPLEFEGLEAP